MDRERKAPFVDGARRLESARARVHEAKVPFTVSLRVFFCMGTLVA